MKGQPCSWTSFCPICALATIVLGVGLAGSYHNLLLVLNLAFSGTAIFISMFGPLGFTGDSIITLCAILTDWLFSHKIITYVTRQPYLGKWTQKYLQLKRLARQRRRENNSMIDEYNQFKSSDQVPTEEETNISHWLEDTLEYQYETGRLSCCIIKMG